MRQSTSREVREKVRRKKFAVLFDFSAWYDQLLMMPAVRRFFGITTPSGSATLKAIPMGFKASCHVAQSITWVLSDFVGGKAFPGVVVDTCIDNVRFCGDDVDELRLAALEFKRRCTFVGATLNEHSVEPTQYEYLGVRYDHRSGTRQLAAKSTRKLKTAVGLLKTGGLCRRQVAAIFGILFFAADVCKDPSTSPALFFESLRYFRREISTDGCDWEAPVQIPMPIQDELAVWLKRLGDNPWVSATSEDVHEDYDLLVVTDASDEGWGAMSISPVTGAVQTASGSWSTAERERWLLARSTVSEPLGILHGLLRFVTPATCRRVLLLVDHQGVIFAVRMGHGRSEAYNHLVAAVARLLPGVAVDAAYIPGKENPVDGLSRGLELGMLGDEVTRAMLARAEVRHAERRARGIGHGAWMV
jgi:hypothetical protein